MITHHVTFSFFPCLPSVPPGPLEEHWTALKGQHITQRGYQLVCDLGAATSGCWVDAVRPGASRASTLWAPLGPGRACFHKHSLFEDGGFILAAHTRMHGGGILTRTRVCVCSTPWGGYGCVDRTLWWTDLGPGRSAGDHLSRCRTNASPCALDSSITTSWSSLLAHTRMNGCLFLS